MQKGRGDEMGIGKAASPRLQARRERHRLSLRTDTRWAWRSVPASLQRAPIPARYRRSGGAKTGAAKPPKTPQAPPCELGSPARLALPRRARGGGRRNFAGEKGRGTAASRMASARSRSANHAVGRANARRCTTCPLRTSADSDVRVPRYGCVLRLRFRGSRCRRPGWPWRHPPVTRHPALASGRLQPCVKAARFAPQTNHVGSPCTSLAFAGARQNRLPRMDPLREARCEASTRGACRPVAEPRCSSRPHEARSVYHVGHLHTGHLLKRFDGWYILMYKSNMAKENVTTN